MLWSDHFTGKTSIEQIKRRQQDFVLGIIALMAVFKICIFAHAAEVLSEPTSKLSELKRKIVQLESGGPLASSATALLEAKVDYLSYAERLECAASASSRLPASEREYFLSLRDEIIETRARDWGNAVLPNLDGNKLRSYDGWIYYKQSEGLHYTKLIPGTCPQWGSQRENESGRPTACYVFLRTGLESESDMWQVDIEMRQYTGRIGRVKRINNSPIVSPDGLKFVHVINPTTRADGSAYLIGYFERAQSPDSSGEMVHSERTLYVSHTGYIDELEWLNPETIGFVVRSESDRSIKKREEIRIDK